MIFKPAFLATGIGSMPFQDPEYAVDVSLSRMSEAPVWPMSNSARTPATWINIWAISSRPKRTWTGFCRSGSDDGKLN